MVNGNNNNLGGLIIGFITILVAVILIGVIANQIEDINDQNRIA